MLVLRKDGEEVTASLAATLRRAAAFLEALPAELQAKSSLSVDDDGQTLNLEWYQRIVRNARLILESDGRMVFLWVAGNDEEGVSDFTFDGVTAPPEIVAAIRRVVP